MTARKKSVAADFATLEAAPAPNFSARVDVFHHFPELPALLDFLGLPANETLTRIEKIMAKIQTDLNRLTKAVDAAEAEKARLEAEAATLAEAEAAEDAAEVVEDEQHAATLVTLNEQIAVLQQRVIDETVTAEEQAQLDALVARVEALGGETQVEPLPDPTDNQPTVEEVPPETIPPAV